MIASTPELICPKCHIPVRPTDYFCFNCGANLHPKPLSTSPGTQIMYYLGSLALPPMGIIWGMRYVRQNDQTSKIVGIVLIALTVFILIVSMQIVMGIINQVNSQMTTTLNTFQGF